MPDALATLPRIGRLTLVDLVRCPSHEARLAYPTLVDDVAQRVGGRLAWSGSIDQQLVGQDVDRFEDVVISEFPTGEACVRALAMRREWRPETFVTETASFAARPWSGAQRFAMRTAFGLMRWLGGAPEPALGRPPAALFEMNTGSPNDPDARQLDDLVAAERDGRVVMLNFLRYRDSAADGADDARTDPRAGEAAYSAYGRVAAPLIARLGGRIRYSARSMRALGPDGDTRSGGSATWDAFVAVEYPSRAAFIGMLADPRYRAAVGDREAGLDATWLLACTAHAAFH